MQIAQDVFQDQGRKHSHTVMSGSFRGKDTSGCKEYCKAMTVFETEKKKGGSIVGRIGEFFKRAVVIRPKKKTVEEPCPA